MPDWALQLLITGGVPLAIVAGGYFANRKLGISSGQKTLVETLQGTVAAQKTEIDRAARQITEMRGVIETCKARLEHVESDNAELKQEVFDLRTDLQKAMSRRPRTTRTRRDDSA
jgi:chromosome segregation ATPase